MVDDQVEHVLECGKRFATPSDYQAHVLVAHSGHIEHGGNHTGAVARGDRLSRLNLRVKAHQLQQRFQHIHRGLSDQIQVDVFDIVRRGPGDTYMVGKVVVEVRGFQCSLGHPWRRTLRNRRCLTRRDQHAGG